MDANTLRKVIEAQLIQFEGNAFQEMCDRLGSILYPDGYHPVRAGGQHGDTKNDGYCPKARIFFAAHATRGESAEKSRTKIRSDLEGCLKQHVDVKVWRFLTNDTLIGEVDQFIDNDLRPKHPNIVIEVWGHKRLADEINKLNHTAIQKILDLNLPILDNPKEETASLICNVVMEVLLSLNQYEEKQYGKRFRTLEYNIESDRKQIEAMLGKVKRYFGDDSSFYKGLEVISSEIKSALRVPHTIGPDNYNKRVSHLKNAYGAGQDLLLYMRERTNIPVRDLDSLMENVQDQTYRWLKDVDYTLKSFFDEAESYSRSILRLHLALILANQPDLAGRYKEFANEIAKLSWAESNTDYMLVQESIPRLALEAHSLDLSREEVQLLGAAKLNNGQINKIKVDAIPGGFIKVGDDLFPKNPDIESTSSFVDALARLQSKDLVQHVSNDRLFHLTSAGWKRVEIGALAINDSLDE